jgi:hypothetical protein
MSKAYEVITMIKHRHSKERRDEAIQLFVIFSGQLPRRMEPPRSDESMLRFVF